MALTLEFPNSIRRIESSRNIVSLRRCGGASDFLTIPRCRKDTWILVKYKRQAGFDLPAA